MSATPEIRHYRRVSDPSQIRTSYGPSVINREPEWVEFTVSPVVAQGAATPVDERLCEAADRRSWVFQRDDATDEELARADREYVVAVRTALLTPSDAFASTKPGEEVTQRLARAAFMVDGTHHFWVDELGRPVCLCGFTGNARKRTQTEHITSAVLEAFDHD